MRVTRTIAVLVACAVAPVVLARTSVAAPPGPFAGLTASRLATVEVRALSAPRARGAHVAPVLLPRSSPPGRGGNGVRVVSDPGAGRGPVAPAAPDTGGATVAATATPSTSGASLTELAGFPVMSLDGQVSALGSGQNVTPPDTQVAAGPADLLEATNDAGSVWSKTGGLVKTFDLDAFFAVPSGSFFSDPRLLYDAPTGRWLMSGLSFNPSTDGSVVYLAISSGGDPTGAWTIYSAAASSNVLHDQPKIGLSADKVVMSWNDFQNAASFIGETTYVWQKSQLLSAASSVAIAGVVDDSSRNSLVPAQAQAYGTADTRAYVVYNRSSCLFCSPAIGVLTVTGTPLQGNVAWSESDPGIPATSTPPSADQPSAPGSIATNDDRFLTAVVQAGTLWTSGNDACVPNGDTVTRPCARFIAVATAGPSVTQDFDLASAGAGLYYPAVGLDQSADLVAVYSISSTALYPGVRVIGESGGSLLAGHTVKSGEAVYNDVPCYAGTSSPSRWGDYSSAATDPSAPGEVWLGGEYAATSSLAATTGCAWGTFTAEMSVGGTAAPAPVAAVSPTSIAFGNQAVGATSQAVTVTVSNTGNASLVVAAGGVSVTDTTDFRIGSDTCSGSTLISGGQCTFAVSFAPASAATFGASVHIADNAAGSPQTVALSGTGVRRKGR